MSDPTRTALGVAAVPGGGAASRRRLRTVSRLLRRRHGKWHAAVEQAGLSANNFLYSLLIVRLVGVDALGVYGFWFVMCQLLANLNVSMVINQMVLRVADGTVAEQRTVLAATFRLLLALQAVQTLALSALVALRPPEHGAIGFTLAVVAYTATLNLAEAARQYLYMRSRQRLSLIYTAFGLSIGAAGFALELFLDPVREPANAAFWFQALGQACYVAIALSAFHRPRQAWLDSREVVADVGRSYWRHGRFATAGAAVTWLQNQSVTPLLMFLFGATAVGYYHVARMIVTPVNMIATGLAKSALPQVRRAWGTGDPDALAAEASVHRSLNMRLVVGYVALAGAVLAVGSIAGLIELRPGVLWMFAATVFVMILSNYRFWTSQQFVVRMRFAYLLRLGIVASALTVAAMLVAGAVLRDAALVILASAIGEIFLIVVLDKALASEAETRRRAGSTRRA